MKKYYGNFFANNSHTTFMCCLESNNKNELVQELYSTAEAERLKGNSAHFWVCANTNDYPELSDICEEDNLVFDAYILENGQVRYTIKNGKRV